MNLDLASKPVKCPNCSGIFYETTEQYDPSKMTTGAMLRFTEKYGPNGYNWSLPFSDNDMSEGIICVECGANMAPSGYLGIFSMDEWERHLASHPKEVRKQILAKPEPVEENPDHQKSVYKGWPKGKKRKPEVNEPSKFQCPMCEKEFGNNTDLGYHLSTHNLEGVEQAAV